MAIIKTTDTRELAEQIHEASRDLLDELSWAAKRIWHTTGEIRRTTDSELSSWGWGKTLVTAGSARFDTASSDGPHHYTLTGSALDQPDSARAGRWEMLGDMRGGRESEYDSYRAELQDFALYTDDVLTLTALKGSSDMKEGSARDSYSLDFNVQARYAGGIDYTYQYGVGEDVDMDDNISLNLQNGSRLFGAVKTGQEAEKGHKASYTLELASRDGLLYGSDAAGSLNKLVFAQQGKTGKVSFDEAYTSQGDLSDIGAALLGGNFAQLTAILLAGDDTIGGGKGNDFLAGGRGADIIKGGNGRDIFHFAAGDSGLTLESADRILDFKIKQDKLQFDFAAQAGDVLVVAAKQASLSAFEALAAEQLQAGKRVVVGSDGHHGYVLVDSGADSQADMLIQLAGIKSAGKIASGDFVFV